MIDHLPRIRAQHMRVLNFRAALIWLLYLVAFLAVLAMAVDGWQKYAEMVEEHAAMVKCINGQDIGVDNAVMRCPLRKDKPLLPLSNSLPQAGERADVKSLLSNEVKS